MSYLLGAAELSLAYLSYHAWGLTDAKSLRLICLAFIVLHAATAMVELLALAQSAQTALWANVALVWLFWL